MSIELLWLIPIVAAALFLPVIVMTNQRRHRLDHGADNPTRELLHEVELFNQAPVGRTMPAEKRLSDIEHTISRVSAALSSQQKIIEGFRGKDVGHDGDLVELKEKLRELQKEYDIVISENYSLRARVKQLSERQRSAGSMPAAHQEPRDEILGPGQERERAKPVNMQLYDDTRMFRVSDITGASEVNLSELG
ncbi:MAG: hypothetical protein GF418_04285 [Chitinivibrionales bacterium]|nr:hypothetical protein [Chitinivibrionales bacterium]MBD3394826.1 hypothetical protein [Chitinivibrionales bacterium]